MAMRGPEDMVYKTTGNKWIPSADYIEVCFSVGGWTSLHVLL